jgi:uncharacterized membrane protein YhaH (DUF805 family)
MATANPYETPQAALETATTIEGYDETSVFSPKGRLGRAAYFVYSFGFSIVVLIVASLLMAILIPMAGPDSAAVPMVSGLLYLVVIPVSFIFMIKRLHDLDWSGWLSLVTLIPLLGLVIAIPMLFFRGTQGANKYGSPRRPVRGLVLIAAVLISIAVLGILAAIAIPAYQGYVKRAQEIQLQQQ